MSWLMNAREKKSWLSARWEETQGLGAWEDKLSKLEWIIKGHFEEKEREREARRFQSAFGRHEER